MEDGLEAVDPTSTIDTLALSECFRLLEREDHQAALTLAERRLASSWWVRPPAPNGQILATKFRCSSSAGQSWYGHRYPCPPA